jgi:DNA-binding transcriptional regulator YiaG
MDRETPKLMPNIGVLLKSEITRLSKKTAKAYVQPLHGSVAAHRRSLAAMKRQIAALEKEIAQLRRAGGKGSVAKARSNDAETVNGGAPLRFQARGLRSLRSRLGLSAEDFGKLAGVSGQSVYNWESEKTVPRRSQLAALAKLRGLGKREVTKMLSESS